MTENADGFVVRPAGPGDARSFLTLWRSVVGERTFVRSDSVHGSVRTFRKRFRSSWTNEEANLVAVHGDRVIGHLSVSREEHPVTRHVASLGMAVAPEWRGRGVGSALMAEAIAWARTHGVEKLALSVYPDNQRALALYAKFGFVEEGRLTGHSRKSIGYRDEIVMGRWLIDPPT
jgi:ribosomal protein S18 acetylase RimI-like enzyme